MRFTFHLAAMHPDIISGQDFNISWTTEKKFVIVWQLTLLHNIIKSTGTEYPSAKYPLA